MVRRFRLSFSSDSEEPTCYLLKILSKVSVVGILLHFLNLSLPQIAILIRCPSIVCPPSGPAPKSAQLTISSGVVLYAKSVSFQPISLERRYRFELVDCFASVRWTSHIECRSATRNQNRRPDFRL